jgi:hypothetical protein
VRLRDRTYVEVVDDMIDGVLAANWVSRDSVPRLRRAFQLALGDTEIDLTAETGREAPTLTGEARVAERQTQAA